MLVAKHRRPPASPGCVAALLLGALAASPFPAHPAPPTPQEISHQVTERGDTIVDSRERSVRAERATGPIVIDGRLDEPDWQRADVASGFRQFEPDEDRPAMEPTEVRILYDDDNIYIGARMFDRDPSSIQRQLTRRGEGGRAYDYFQVSLDSNRDGRTGYTFRITAAGVQVDRYNYDDTLSDESWNAIWESAASVDAEGWIAELRIPLSQLRYGASPREQTWGVDFGRRKISTNERTDWAYVPRGLSGGVSRWGRLEDIVLPERRRHVELLPYVMTGLKSAPAHPEDPFFDGRAGRGNLGADLRFGLGSTFVLDAALTPDFGQVEVDPRVVNLSAFESFFPEQRPFFTRDDRIFDFGLSGGSNNLFYSRRIGRSPQGRAPPGASFTDIPSESRILGLAKVTGRTASGLTIGLLGGVSERERGRAVLDGDPEVWSFDVEPRTGSGTVRLVQELRDGASTVGTIATLLARDLPGDGSLDFLTRRAVSAGLDFEHTWSDRDWALWGFFAGSHVTGSEAAITRILRSPNHYHQRPDQDYLGLDPDATSLTGFEWRLQLDRRGGRNWGGAIWAAQRTPGFEVNDLGFSTASERVDGGARISYQQPTPGEVLRSWSGSASTFHNWRLSVLDDPFSWRAWEDARKAGQFSGSANFTFLNYWGLRFSGTLRPGHQSDQLTRGGPLMTQPTERSFSVSGGTDERDKVSWSASFGVDRGAEGSRGWNVSAGVEARPANGVLLSLEPTFQRSLDRAQYVTRLPDPAFKPTFGSRYLFGELERRQFSVDTRVNLIFSPTLSFQFFAQPLVSSGAYPAFRQLAAPATYDFLEFEEGSAVTVDGGVRCQGGAFCRHDGQIHLDYAGDGETDVSLAEQNFYIRSLRGSAVFRWEYRSGSRIYLVWQQSRQAQDPTRDFAFGRDLGALWNLEGEHRFMLKVDYWLSL